VDRLNLRVHGVDPIGSYGHRRESLHGASSRENQTVTGPSPPSPSGRRSRPRWRYGFWDYFDQWGHYVHLPKPIQRPLCSIADYWNDSPPGRRTDRAWWRQEKAAYKRKKQAERDRHRSE
jgi:hypothetical protein